MGPEGEKMKKMITKNYYVDYHMHSTNSSDGKNTVEEMCIAAIKNGFAEIAITDHFEPSLGDEGCVSYTQSAYFNEVLSARRKFGKQLDIKLGVEIGQPQYFKKQTEETLSKVNYDYVLASAHKLESGADMSQLDYKTMSKKSVLDLYLKELNRLVDEFDDFDCVAHLDLVKRYSYATYLENITLADSREQLEIFLKKLIKKGKGIEINTSGLRQNSKETLPGLDVLRIYKELGGTILTVGSDAHKTEDLGKGILDAYKLAEEAGFQHITIFTNRQPEFIKIAGNAVKRGA